MRKPVIDMIGFGTVGAVLGTLEAGLTSWQFWTIMISITIVQINNIYGEGK